jgi:zinc transport system substrate-binding protein
VSTVGRVLVLVAAAVALVALAACGEDDPSVTAAQAGDPVVVTGLWPLAELIDRVGGGRVVVVNMTPVGESPHDLALTARQRDEVQRADLAVVIGRGFQPELEDAAAGGGGEVLSLLDTLDLPDQPAGGHVWLDPTLMGTIATTIGEALAALDPDAADDHRERAQELVEQLVALDARIGAGLADCERDALVTQHDAFGWFAARYGLRTFALDAAQPDDDPAPEPAMVVAVEPLVRDGSVVTLFTETLLPPSWVEVLAEERGLETDVLNPYEGLTATESARDVDYERVQLSNLQTLREHLDCAAS